jgi:hypothetical protein
MRTAQDVEAYLLRLRRPFDNAGEPTGAPTAPTKGGGESATYLLPSAPNMPAIALRVEPPLVVLRVHIGDVAAEGGDAGLLRRLLELNAKSLVHASYGLDGAKILLSAALELENLDFNELQATLDELDLALAQHVPMLAELSSRPPPAPSPKASA